MIRLTEECYYEIMSGIMISERNGKYYLHSTKTKDGMEITKETYESLTNDFVKKVGGKEMSVYNNILRDIDDCEEKGYEIDYINVSYKSYMELFHELNGSYYNIGKPKTIKTIQGLDVKVDLNMQDGYSIVLKELAIDITPIKHITQRLTEEEISEFVNYILKYYA